MSKKEELKFEEAMERLEVIVSKLETGQVSLDESLRLFEEGIKLSSFCNAKLEEVEGKIEIITKTSANGEVSTEPFIAES